MRILIKIGGTLLDSPEHRHSLASQIAELSGNGHKLAVVHGGGKQITAFLSERNVESRFVDGLRVTTAATMDAVLKVLAGTVNGELVSALTHAGAGAVGLTGLDGWLVQAERMSPELGAVGRITGANSRLLDVLSDGGFIPVIACVAGDSEGRFWNVNADQMAVACASAFQADRLIFLTDVKGVLGADGLIFPALSAREARELIDSGVAKGGMMAKLNAAALAIDDGVAQVRIAPGFEALILNRLLSGEALGTVIEEFR
ncbi:MAG: acetylglutamate kinase [Acidobacteriota bacterium]|nr:acetylglutamate kinase [Acidobacteriota bacterium]